MFFQQVAINFTPTNVIKKRNNIYTKSKLLTFYKKKLKILLTLVQAYSLTFN